MNTPLNNGPSPNSECPGPYSPSTSGHGEDTLRLIASLPAPDGLADRVKGRLRAAPKTARILMWPGPIRPAGGWMYSTVARGAAAAAIVCVVAGGGWRIYSHVQPAPATKGLVMPAPLTMGNGFSNSSAKRVPETLQGPVLTHPTQPPVELNVIDKTTVPPAETPGIAAKKKKTHLRHSGAPTR